MGDLSWEKNLSKLAVIAEGKKWSLSQCVEFCLDADLRKVSESYLNHFQKPHSKDSGFASKAKEDGNKKYKNKEFKDSLFHYTQSIFHAPKDDKCLALAYSNRAIVLEILGHPLESITDIDIALACGYPKEKVANLMVRKARCLMQLGDTKKAREILTETLKNADSEEYRQVIENELEKITDTKCREARSEFKLPEPVGGENENFPFASKYIDVYYDESRGRQVIANKDIEAGDILIVEKPFAFVIRGNLCSHCGKETIALHTCWECTDVCYCSPKCRDDSWNSYHSFECGFSEFFKSIGIAHLSFRVILEASHHLDELKEILAQFSKPVYEKGSIVQIKKGYEGVHNLLDHSDQYKKTDLFQYVMTALLVALYLKHNTSYFPTESTDEDLSFLTTVISRHLLQMPCNAFCISDISSSHEGNFRCLDEIQHGTAIYTSASMMNHSCKSSVEKRFYGNYLIVSAEGPIKKGEEVLNCYGPNAKAMSKAERHKALAGQYFFECKCQSCLQKFDIMETGFRFTCHRCGLREKETCKMLTDKVRAFKCPKCKGPSVLLEEEVKNALCLSCGQNNEISLDLWKKYHKFYSLMDEGKVLFPQDTSSSLEKYLQAWRIGREIFYKFHEDLALAADKVAQCLVELKEFQKSILFLKCSIRAKEERFGSKSFEISTSYKTLADIIQCYIVNNVKAKDIKKLAHEAFGYYKKVEEIQSIFPDAIKLNVDLKINMNLLQKYL